MAQTPSSAHEDILRVQSAEICHQTAPAGSYVKHQKIGRHRRDDLLHRCRAEAGFSRYSNETVDELCAENSDILTPDRWLKDFAEIGIKDDVRPPILKENARRILKM